MPNGKIKQEFNCCRLKKIVCDGGLKIQMYALRKLAFFYAEQKNKYSCSHMYWPPSMALTTKRMYI